jgi:hypothetical protein
METAALTDKDGISRELQSCRFCPSNIIEYFEKCTLYMKMHARNISYHIYYERPQDVPSITKLMKSMRHSIALTKFFGMKKKFDVHVIMSPYRRFFPVDDNGLISAEHINGGYTDTNTNNIYILRSEEFSKVILHELLHHCNKVHGVEDWLPHHINKLKSEFDIHQNCKLVPNEAIVELWAIVLHSMFLSFDYKMYYKTILAHEINHSIMKSCMILKKQKKMHEGKWNEHTNAYCYIVFKCILLRQWENLDARSMHRPEYIIDVLINNKQSDGTATDKGRSLRMCRTSDL